MRDETHYQSILTALRKSWQRANRAGGMADLETLLSSEIEAFVAGETAHLPYVASAAQTTWMTVSPDASTLRSAMTGLRAWIIPSFGWEDPKRPIVAPSAYSGELANALSSVSPAGYYRWHSTTAGGVTTVVEKLAAWRRLGELRPLTANVVNRSLFELREQFYLAVATGDRTLAEESVEAIDQRQLDTASNTSFMRTRIRARFGSHDQIVHDPNLDRMLVLRLPKVTANSIIEAFFEFYIRPLLESGRNAEAQQFYKAALLPRLGGLLADADGTEGDGASWFLAELAESFNGKVLEPAKQDDEQAFISALRRRDWRLVQELGIALSRDSDTSPVVRQFVRSALVESLANVQNEYLSEILEPASGATPQTSSWFSIDADITEGHFSAAETFLDMDMRPILDPVDQGLIKRLLSFAEETMTDPDQGNGTRFDIVANRLLPVLIEDTIGDLEYPRCEIVEGYLTLLDLWVTSRAGRSIAGESNVVLSLAASVLQCSATSELVVIEHLRMWWTCKPVKATLPYLLAALELLADFSSAHGTAQGLWIDGASFIKDHNILLTSTERALWKSIGLNLGFDQGTVAEYLTVHDTASQSQDPSDIFATSDLKKVAIISLHEKSAKAAAELIRERFGAEVIIVSDHVAGAATQSAQSADVVLVVWAATKHSVYRAFDKVRDKLAYVQGTGPSSILLALERWLMTSA
jgi:hypothetical protein